MDAFKHLLQTNSPSAQQLGLELRKLILRLMPGAAQKIYRGLGVADYGFGTAGRGFVTLGPQKTSVNLYFMNGEDLPGPTHLLEGTGKKLRRVKIRTAQDLGDRHLAILVKEALKRKRAESCVFRPESATLPPARRMGK